MAGWNLGDIIAKVRATTGRPDASMMTDATIATYINNYYQYVLPKELKIFWGYTYYDFWTRPQTDQYVAPVTFQTVNPQAWADGFPIEWYTSPDLFYEDWPEQLNKVIVASTDGVNNGPYSYTTPAFPVLPGSVYVTDGRQVVRDVPVQALAGVTTGTFAATVSGVAVGGTITYATGAVTGLTFVQTPAANLNIQQSSATYQANRPQGILFFKANALANSTLVTRDTVNMFVLRPVPDNVYRITMQGIQIPAPLLLGSPGPSYATDVPFRTDLGPLIAYGASLEVFADFNQMDQYDQIQGQYQRYKDISMQDTYEEYLYERSVARF